MVSGGDPSPLIVAPAAGSSVLLPKILTSPGEDRIVIQGKAHPEGNVPRRFSRAMGQELARSRSSARTASLGSRAGPKASQAMRRTAGQ